MNNLPWIITDLDGTISDDQHRKKYWVAKDYDTYHELANIDKPYPDVVAVLNMFRIHCRIAIITARPMYMFGETTKWLYQHNIYYDEIFMRPKEKSNLYSPTLKQEIYKEHFSTRKVLLALEDREDICEMWMSLGLTCLLVR